MSAKHPVIAITGSSGAGTTSVSKTFEQIFYRENVKAAFVEGDAFHRYDREEMKRRMAEEVERGNHHFSHFGPEANLFAELEQLFRDYAATGGGRTRKYLHNDAEAAPYKQKPGTFTPWEDLAAGTDKLFYESPHGGAAHREGRLRAAAMPPAGSTPRAGPPASRPSRGRPRSPGRS